MSLDRTERLRVEQSARSLLAALVAASAAIASCADEDETSDPCADLSDACGRQGEMRCATTSAVQTCEVNEDGCLAWALTDSCDGLQSCEPTAGGYECVCDDSCLSEGPLTCDGDVIIGCVPDENGCLVYRETRDCEAEDLVCDDTTGAPDCVRFCADRCETEGATECAAALILTCYVGPLGCLSQRVSQDCSADSRTCDDSSGRAVCVAE